MAVMTAGTSIKDGFLPGIDEPAEVGAGIFPDAADEAKPPRTTLTEAELDEIGITERDYSKMDILERSAYRLKLKGHDVWIVDEKDDDFDIRKYIDAKTLAYLDSMTLDENWRDKQG